MNSLKKRILAAALVGIAMATAVFIPLPKTGVVVFAYASVVLMFVLGGASLWRAASGGKKEWITNLAFPLSLRGYIIGTLAMAVLFPTLQLKGIWAIDVLFYAVLYVILLGFTAWRLLAIGAAQEKIHKVGATVREKVTGWRMFQADVEAILAGAPASVRNEVAAVRDAVRYADPMSCPQLAEIDQGLMAEAAALKAHVAAGNEAAVRATCAAMLAALQDRATRLKVLK